MKKRRQYSADFKAKVALEALRETSTLHEIAKRHQVHPTQVTEWKKSLMGNAGDTFPNKGNKEKEKLVLKLKEDRLYRQIGHLQVQVDFLKDSCDKLGVIVPEDELH